MSQTTTSSFDLVERQQAFVGLLTRPLLTRSLDPHLHKLVTRHRASLTKWCAHLGYRLTLVGTTFRLRRGQATGPATVPAGEAPDRRELVLLLVIAAALEENQSDTVDIQTLSDAVRDTVAVQDLTPYDPGRRADRRLLVTAVRRAEQHGVLQPLTRDDLLDAWEARGEGIGAGYAINRHALFLLVDPVDLTAARTPVGGDDEIVSRDPHQPDPRAQRLLRALLETHGIELARLSDDDREYWRRQRGRLNARATEFTGGGVEVTADSVALILPTDHHAAREATQSFPSAKATHWVTLKLLDEAARTGVRGAGGSLSWTSAQVDDGSDRLSRELGDKLMAELRGNPSAIRLAAQKTLGDAGLLELTDAGGWRLSPLAARYRSATLRIGARTSTLTEDDE